MSSELHVIFGTGPVGMAIMEELCRQGKRIRMVNRSGKTSEPISSEIELISGDVRDPQFAAKAAQGATVAYNALNPPYTQWPELFPALQAGVIAGAAAAGAKLVVMDNVYMYGDPGGKPIHEGLPYNAHTRKGETRAQMARDLMAAHERGEVQVTVGRASDFFGPRTLASAMGERVFYPALQGKAAQVVGNADALHTYTYMPDIGRALVTLGQHDEAFGEVWHIPGPQAISTRAFVEKVYAEAGNPVKLQVANGLMVRMLGLFVGEVREMVEMMYEFNQDFVVDHSKFERTFGMTATPLDEAIRETVAWYRENPQKTH